MKIIATDSAHAALPYQMLSYELSRKFRLPLDFGTIYVKDEIAKELDGLECLVSASLTVNSGNSHKRINRLMKYMDKLRHDFPGFDYYAFHGLFENQPKQMKDYELNLADNDSLVKAHDIERWISYQITLARLLSNQKKVILNLHPGYIDDKIDMRKRMKNLISILQSCLGKANNVFVCFENMPPASEGYNIFQNPEDFMNLFNNKYFGITYDLSHLECTRYFRNMAGGKKRMDPGENREDFLNFHDDFITVYDNIISYAHIVFNDISLSGRKRLDPYYKEDKHTPPCRIHDQFFRKFSFEPVVKKALKVIRDNMGEYACANVEVPRKKVFFTTYCRDGATEAELIESYRYVRDLASCIDKKPQ